MARTNRYWDGGKWTDDVAPAGPESSSGPSALTVARGVALGIVIVIAGIWFLYSCQGESALDCSLRNVERVNAGLPPVECPD